MNSSTIIRVSTPTYLIDSIRIPGVAGEIGITFCPGIRDESTIDHNSERMVSDLRKVRAWGADVVVTLMETAELQALGVSDLGKNVLALDMVWFHRPLRNKEIPDELSNSKWRATLLCLCNLLRQGQWVVVHCDEGIGRAALVAFCLLLGLDVPVEEAIMMVRRARPGSLQLHSHVDYCRSLAGEWLVPVVPAARPNVCTSLP